MYFGNNDGILEFDGTSWRLIHLPENSGVYSLAIGRDGKIYAGGTGEFGFLVPDNKGTMRYISIKDKIPVTFQTFSDRINKINITDKSIVFLSDKLLFVLQDANITVIQTDDYFFSSTFNNQNLYLIDGGKGLLKLQSDRLQPVPGGTFIRSYLMLPFQDGSILIMTPDRGLGILNVGIGNTSTDIFTPLPEQDLAFIRKLEIKSAVVLNSGNIALSTIKNGCIIVNPTGRQKIQINESIGMECNTVYSVNRDVKGDLWLGLDCGIAFVKPGTFGTILQHVASDSIAGIDISAVVEMTKPFVFSAIIRSVETIKDDSLIFGGAFYITLGSVQNLIQSEIMQFVFPYTLNAFRISYSSNYLDEFGKIEYQTLLEGMDDEWMKWSNRTIREYTSLYWGKYTFRVRARNAQGNISKEATYSFRIREPWFESWWFYGGQVALLLFLLSVSGFLQRMGKAQKLSGAITTIVVVVIFKYFHMSIAPVIGIFSSTIAFFKILMSIIIGFVINPAQGFVQRSMEKLTGMEKTENEFVEETE